jgi:hypothetical protein
MITGLASASPGGSLTAVFASGTDTRGVHDVGLYDSTDLVERRGAGWNEPGRIVEQPLIERQNILSPAAISRAALPQRNYLGLALCLRHHHPRFHDAGVWAVTSEALLTSSA